MKLFQLFESNELVSELLWFQRYITDHDLETQMEIENNKIVFRVDGKLIKWNAAEARRIRTEVITNALVSYTYAVKIKRRFELGEPEIMTNAGFSFLYAEQVIKGRFELGEPAISKDSDYSFYYARDVIKGRFELGEPVILKAVQYAQKYKEFLDSLK